MRLWWYVQGGIGRRRQPGPTIPPSLLDIVYQNGAGIKEKRRKYGKYK